MSFFNGMLASVAYLVNTMFWVIPIVLLAILKLIPIARWQRGISYLLDGCASCWVHCNSLN